MISGLDDCVILQTDRIYIHPSKEWFRKCFSNSYTYIFNRCFALMGIDRVRLIFGWWSWGCTGIYIGEGFSPRFLGKRLHLLVLGRLDPGHVVNLFVQQRVEHINYNFTFIFK